MTATAASTLCLTNREIDRIYSALVALSQRRLEGPQNEKKVVTLLRRYFEAPHKVIEDLRGKIIKEHPAPEEWDDTSLPIGIAEMRMHLINQMLDDTQEIAVIPEHLYITDADMPKPIKGELGDQNKFGVADIRNKLGFLYAIEDDETDGTRAKE